LLINFHNNDFLKHISKTEKLKKTLSETLLNVLKDQLLRLNDEFQNKANIAATMEREREPKITEGHKGDIGSPVTVTDTPVKPVAMRNSTVATTVRVVSKVTAKRTLPFAQAASRKEL
jgi:hypothetical protein